MKLKHFVILLFFVLLAGTIFYFGWIQIQLSENTYGVGFTKSDGYLKKLYEPGKFSWEIRKLIPGNFKLLKFKLYLQQVEISEQGQLPSGDIYSEYLPEKPDFSYHLKYNLTYKIKIESFPGLVAELSLNPDQMTLQYKSITADIQVFISNFYKNKAQNSNYAKSLFYSSNEISNELLAALSKEFPSLDFLDFVSSEIIMPDPILYSKGKEIYLASLDLQNKVISESKIRIAEQEVIDNANFATLKKYGELLNEYPSLINLFSVMNIDSSGIIPKPDFKIPNNTTN